MAGLPPTWAIIIAIIGLLFGGGGAVVWSFRRELRESRIQPAAERAAELENQRAAAEIAQLLRQEQSAAMAEMRTLLNESRAETAKVRAELSAVQAQLSASRLSDALFRDRVLQLLNANSIQIPDWWHSGTTMGDNAH